MRNLKSSLLLALVAMCGAGACFAAQSYATTTIQANICNSFAAPTITQPQTDTETKKSSVQVKGTGEPGMLVTILNHGENAGSVTVTASGSYAVEVPLEVGNNALVARETDGCDNSMESSVVTVYRVAVTPSDPSPSEHPATSQSPAEVVHPGDDTSPLRGGSGRSTEPPHSSDFQPPVITSPHQNHEIDTDRIWVKGQAPPGSMVIMYVNGVEVARIIASDQGTFGVMVPLSVGKNTLQARAELGDQAAFSNKVEVYYIKYVQRTMLSHVEEWRLMGISAILLIVIIVIAWCIYRYYRNKKKGNI